MFTVLLHLLVCSVQSLKCNTSSPSFQNRSINTRLAFFLKLVSFFSLLPVSLFLFCCLSLVLPFPRHQLTAIPFSPLSRTNKQCSRLRHEGWLRPSVSSLSPSPGRVGKMTGRGVGMKALSGHQSYLASAINPLTAKTLGGVYVKDQCCCGRKREIRRYTHIHTYI